MRTLATLALAATALIATAAAPASAQDWPTRSVKIIVAFSPGGSADQFGRLIAEELSETFGQQFYIEYHPGSSGTIGAALTARAAPDGYTLMIGGSGPHITSPAINPNVGYDPIKDFSHIAMIGADGFVLIANPTLGIGNLADLVKTARARQTPLTFSSPGPGSLGQLMMEQFKRKAGIELVHVPAPNSGLMEVLGNHIALSMTGLLTSGEQIKAGGVTAVAVTSTERNPVYKDIPTFTEQGYPEVHGDTWFWLTGPKEPAAGDRRKTQSRGAAYCEDPKSPRLLPAAGGLGDGRGRRRSQHFPGRGSGLLGRLGQKRRIVGTVEGARNMDARTEKDSLAAELAEPRARIGLIIPSVNRMTEPQFNHYAPEGLGIHVARGRVAGQPGKTVAELTDEIAHAAGTLADAGPDLIVFHCTNTSMKEGADGEARIINLIEKTTGIEALSTSSLVKDALRALGLKKLVLLSPYMSNAPIISYLNAAGFTVVKDVALKCATAADFEAVTPQRWLELARENDTPEADGIFLSCTNTTQIEAVTAIEEALGKPVVNSNQAVLWGCLKRLKEKLGDGEPTPNLGRLMKDLED